MKTFRQLTPEECPGAPAEIHKFRHLIAPYCMMDDMPMPTLEIASGGACCVPWALSFDLPVQAYSVYNSNHLPRGPIHVRGDCLSLPFESDSFWAVSASHILEDYPQSRWQSIMREWARVVMRGGYLIIAIPDHERWWQYVNIGGIHNFAHAQPQPNLGDLSSHARAIGLTVVSEEYTNCYEVTTEKGAMKDFTILGVFRNL